MVVRGERTASYVGHEVRARRAEVVAVTDLTPRMRRVTLRGDLADLPGDGPTDHVKLFFPLHGEESIPDIGPRGLLVPPPGTPRPYREYTVRRHDGDEVDVDVVRHGSGLASSWVEDPVGALWLLGPRSSLEVAPRDWYLLGGDETALPALARVAHGRHPAPRGPVGTPLAWRAWWSERSARSRTSRTRRGSSGRGAPRSRPSPT